jgi:hypothetical protein
VVREMHDHTSTVALSFASSLNSCMCLFGVDRAAAAAALAACGRAFAPMIAASERPACLRASTTFCCSMIKWHAVVRGMQEHTSTVAVSSAPPCTCARV